MKKLLLLLLLISGIVNAQIVEIPDPAFKTALISFGYDTNNDGNIQVSEVQSITNLNVSFLNIGDLTGISSFTSLVTLECMGDVNPTNTLTTIDVSAISTLEEIRLSDNDITNAIFNSGIQRVYLNGNQLTSFDPSPYPNLVMLDLGGNQLIDFTVHGNSLSLELGLNSLTNVNLSGTFSYLSLAYNSLLTTIDLSQSSYGMLWFSDSPVTILNLKNGYNGDYNLSDGNYPDVLFVCVDDYAEAQYFQSFSDNNDLHWVVNPYCSFTPGGDFNTITGTALFDSDGNGCDTGDIQNDFIKINVANDGNPGATFSTANGNYAFYTGAGTYTVTPQLENEGWFTITPPNAVVNFPVNDNSISVNNFCITADSVHPDVEVVIGPYVPARPGFEAVYKIIYRNKGNQTLSGNVTFSYNESLLDFVSADPVANLSEPGVLIFNYTDLLPFENREILVTVEVNAPTDTLPVNIDDILDFTATVSPVLGDENPEDNVFNYHQIVVGSYDPNDKVCIEGNQVHPDNIGKYLHYMINFENTGTAAAENVVIKDIIDTGVFDINTLQVMNSSHNLEVSIRGNVAEFIFRNINLPSAISNPIGGHGNVLFKIKTLPTLYDGDVVTNTANIYFDYNHPIETNEARTTFSTLKRQEFVTDHSVVVYPNPAKNNIAVQAKNNIQSIALFDIQGRVLQVIPANSNKAIVDISDQTNGIYFIKVTTADGVKVEKIIKE